MRGEGTDKTREPRPSSLADRQRFNENFGGISTPCTRNCSRIYLVLRAPTGSFCGLPNSDAHINIANTQAYQPQTIRRLRDLSNY